VIDNPASSDILAVTLFLLGKNMSFAETHCCAVYDQNVMREETIGQWWRYSVVGRRDVRDEK
jgi:hypothetical protein